VDTGTPDQLQLSNEPQPFNFIWIAASARGTVLKVDTRIPSRICEENITAYIVGKYRSGPDSAGFGDPSRTTVDSDGSVWVANRKHDPGSIVHIGLEQNGQCEDRNGNGKIDTSKRLNDTKSWKNESGVRGVGTAEDECIVHYTRVNSNGTRHLSIDSDNNVWVGGFGTKRYWDLVKGGHYSETKSGTILKTYDPVMVGDGTAFGGYGGLHDKNGVLWSSRPLLRWETALNLTGENGDPDGLGPSIGPPINGTNWTGQTSPESYGLCIDSMGNVWSTQLNGSLIDKYASDGTHLGNFTHGNEWAQGCVVDRKGYVWVAHSNNSNTVGHLRNNGSFVGNVNIATQGGPTGVAVDSEGKVWATSLNTNSVYRIDPLLKKWYWGG
jgi:sugar lactone lactonase YvrE